MLLLCLNFTFDGMKSGTNEHGYFTGWRERKMKRESNKFRGRYVGINEGVCPGEMDVLYDAEDSSWSVYQFLSTFEQFISNAPVSARY